MNLKITSSEPISIGGVLSNIIGDINAHTDSLLTTGEVQCDISWLKDATAKIKNYDRIWPVVLNGDDTINLRVASCDVTLTEQEVMAADLPTTIYTKVAEKLALDYGWTVVVE